MKKYIFLSFIVGGAFGASVTMFVLNKKHEAELDYIYEEELKDERAELRKTIRNIKENGHHPDAIPKLDGLDAGPVIFDEYVEEDKMERLGPDVPIYNDYKKVAKHYKPDLEEVSKAMSPINTSEPYVIDMEDFSEDHNEFDKLTIYYYEEDGVLVDDNEELITDISSVIGDQALPCFDDPERYDKNVVYVRNERLSIDYEIIKVDSSYQSTIYGGEEEDE